MPTLKELNSLQLVRILRNDKCTRHVFKGVFARDQLPRKVSFPSCCIVNTDPISLPGEHWLALYYDEFKTCHFFDSYGFHPRFYHLETFIKKTSSSLVYNRKKLQSLTSSLCGYYCFIFLMLKCRNIDFLIEEFNDGLIEKIFIK